MIIWLIGLSGSGKTTLANALKVRLEKQGKKASLIDGDQVRASFGHDLGYSIADRRKNAERIIAICKELEKKNNIIIASLLHNFPDQRKLNRYEFKSYFEVYIKAKKSTLIKRDTKEIYKKFKNKKIKNVVGFDIKFKEPSQPDLIIKAEDSIEKNSKIIIKKIFKSESYRFDNLNPQKNKLFYTYSKVNNNFIINYKSSRQNFIQKYKASQQNTFFRNFSKNKVKVENLYRTFEINRKLSNKSGKEINLNEYINISLIFSYYLKKKRSYKVLNSLLKLNDYILYKIKKIDNVRLKRKFSSSLIFEQNIIEKIYNEK